MKTLSGMRILALCFASVACQLLAQQGSTDGPVKQVTEGPTGAASSGVGFLGDLMGSLLNPTESAFRASVKERRLEAAINLYRTDGPWLVKNKDLAREIEDFTAQARERYKPDLESAVLDMERARQEKTYGTDLSAYVLKMKGLEDAIGRYLRVPILSDFQSSDLHVARSRAEALRARTDLRANLASIYRDFPHERASFREQVPDVQSETDLLRSSWDVASSKLQRLSDSDAQKFVKNTASAWTSDPELRAKVSAAVWTRVSGSDRGVVAAARNVPRVEEYGIDRSDLPGMPRILVANTASASDLPITFTGRHAGSLKSPSDLTVNQADAPTILIEIQDAGVKRNIVDKREVNSQFKSGVRSVPNPNYAIAQMNCQRAQSDLGSQRARNTIAPAQGWGALLQGIAEGVLAANVKKVCDEFAYTSPSQEEDVFSSYSYTVTDIELTRRVDGRVLALGPTGAIELYPLAFEAKQRAAVAYGRKEADTSNASGVITDAEFEKVAAQPFSIDAERAVLALEPGSRVERARETLASLLVENARRAETARLSSGQAVARHDSNSGPVQVAHSARQTSIEVAAIDPRMNSVVVVLNPKGSIGAGFYVDSNDILTNFHVVEGANTIELRGLDGQLFTGRVQRKDIGLDLALIRVERAGQAVAMSQTILKAGDTVEAIGHPKGLTFTVSRGIVSSVRQMKGMLAQGGDKALVIQTDAAINPGNSGGPLFHNGRVVGVNTVKFKGAEGIGFAVHYSEVMKFLSQ